jgi:hypothetical protein
VTTIYLSAETALMAGSAWAYCPLSRESEGAGARHSSASAARAARMGRMLIQPLGRVELKREDTTMPAVSLTAFRRYLDHLAEQVKDERNERIRAELLKTIQSNLRRKQRVEQRR